MLLILQQFFASLPKDIDGIDIVMCLGGDL